MNNTIDEIKDLLNRSLGVTLNHIPRNFNELADYLVGYARHKSGLLLYPKGMELPH